MPSNKFALIRYKTIDNCLSNRFRKWTLEDIQEAVSEALYEYEGVDSGVSRRTIQSDIQVMRSDKLGYNAPIVVYERRYYKYDDPEYSITKAPINERDLKAFKESVAMLRQFSGFQYFVEMESLLTKLDDQLLQREQQQESIIQFESNPELKGLQYLRPLYQAITDKQVVELEYQSFKAQKSQRFFFSPYLLKEFRNRWFVIGRRSDEEKLSIRALDRIKDLRKRQDLDYAPHQGAPFSEYYSDLIGVTKQEQQDPVRVVLFFSPIIAPYLHTKPLHSSQEVLREDERGCILSIRVVHNLELEREVLGFGRHVKVLAPADLQRRIREHLHCALQQYEEHKK